MAPGETQQAFGARLGVDPGRLSRWKCRLQRAAPRSRLPTRSLTRSRSAVEPVTAFAHVGTVTLGRPTPFAVVELVADQVRVELHSLEHGDACLASVFRALEAMRRR